MSENSILTNLARKSEGLAAAIGQVILLAATAAATIATIGSALGFWPWLSLPLGLVGGEITEAGQAVQIGLTLFLLSQAAFLPASRRVQRLETSHRRFHSGMEDVAQAYYAAHAADRSGAFRLKHEFDAVRERLVFLRDHPDIGHLDPEILELAAQMSFIGRDLAEIYSDDKVAAARTSIAERMEAASRFEADIARATEICASLRASLDAVEDRETGLEGDLDHLRGQLDEILPRLGLGFPPSRPRIAAE